MDILFYAAVVPGLFFIWYVYTQDKMDREPFGLMVKLIFLGGISIFVAMLVEGLLISGLNNIFPKKNIIYLLVENFFCIALVEEYVKYYVLKKTWHHPAFDYRFDGIIYAVAVGMGFAILENIFYVYGHGLNVAMMRACTSLPGHCIFAIYMGYYYGAAKKCASARKHWRMRGNLWLALFVPILLHGIYDFLLSSKQQDFMIAFFIFIIILDWRAYKKLKFAAKTDRNI